MRTRARSITSNSWTLVLSGKAAWLLEERSKLEASRLGNRLAEDDAMRIADRDQHRLDAPCRRIEADAVGLAVEQRRQIRGTKGRPPDV